MVQLALMLPLSHENVTKHLGEREEQAYEHIFFKLKHTLYILPESTLD